MICFCSSTEEPSLTVGLLPLFVGTLLFAGPTSMWSRNVPGMKKFPVVMEAMTKLPDYYVHVACPVKSSIWLPQKRDRLIIIGSRRNFAWREPAVEKPVTLSEILEPDPAPHIPDLWASVSTALIATGPSSAIRNAGTSRRPASRTMRR